MQKVDLVGQVFSLLTVIKEVPPLNNRKRYLCICECGGSIEKSYSSLKSTIGNKSCGCMSKTWQAEAKKTHGDRYVKLYAIWRGIKSRSINSGTFNDRDKHAEYKRKSITICQEWLDYTTFSKWAKENGYKEDQNLSIDRRDNEKGYFPDNCRWTTKDIQAQNTKVIWATNTTGYRGVSITTRKKNPYRAIIYVKGKQINLGNYSTALEAAIAYDTYVKNNSLEHNSNNLLESNTHAQWEIQQTAQAMRACIEIENS